MIRRITHKILNGISILFIILAAVILLSVVINPAGTAPSIFGYSVLRVVTGSMEPNIEVDELILVKKIDEQEIQVGDIISFYSRDKQLNGKINTHRVVSVEQENGEYTFATQGDANELMDKEMVKESDILGKVVGHTLLLGKLVKFLLNPIVFFICIIIPLVGMLVSYIKRTICIAKELTDEE